MYIFFKMFTRNVLTNCSRGLIKNSHCNEFWIFSRIHPENPGEIPPELYALSLLMIEAGFAPESFAGVHIQISSGFPSDIHPCNFPEISSAFSQRMTLFIFQKVLLGN